MPASARRILSALLFALILFGGLRRNLFVLPFSDRRPLQRELASAADRAAPQYPAFLEEVWRRTNPQASIALVFRPSSAYAPSWYAYFRARYFLLDRVVLPVIGIDGVPHPEHLDQALYVTGWGVDLADDRFQTIWRGNGGQLARRRP
jgi:hypothetical protein